MEQELLFDLLRKAVSPFACVQAAGERLAANGFEAISYSDEWKLKKGGKYIVNHHDTTLFAFTIGGSIRLVIWFESQQLIQIILI